MIKISYEDMAMFFLVAFYLLEQNRQNRILRMLYFPPVAFMARNSEIRIAILRYFANMYTLYFYKNKFYKNNEAQDW